MTLSRRRQPCSSASGTRCSGLIASPEELTVDLPVLLDRTETRLRPVRLKHLSVGAVTRSSKAWMRAPDRIRAGKVTTMDHQPGIPMNPRQAAETLRSISAIAFRRQLAVDRWSGAFLDHAAGIYELAAMLIEDAADDNDVRRALEALRLHEGGAETFVLRWVCVTAADFIETALLTESQNSGGIPPTGTRP